MKNSRLRPAILPILLVAFFLRVHDLNTYPPGISGDEAHGAVEAMRLVDVGSYPFFTDVDHPEAFDIVPWALGIALMGARPFAVRLMTAFIGLLAVAATYRAGRDLLRDTEGGGEWAGLLAAGAMATFAWHVALSRSLYRGVHLNVAQALFISQIALGLRRGRRANFAWAGFWLGASLYTYTAARAFVFILPGLLLFWALFNRRLLWQNRAGFLILLAVFAVAVLPLAYVYLTTPDVLFLRMSHIGSLPRSPAEVARILLDWPTLQRAAAIFYSRGAGNPQYNVPYAPIVGVYLLPLFVAGLALALLRLFRWQYAMVIGMLLLMLAPVYFAGEMPHGLREAGLFVPVSLLIGAAAAQVASWAGRVQWRGAGSAWAGVAAVIVAAAAIQTSIAYRDFWDVDIDGSLWWFFAYDRVAAAEVIRASDEPMYVPTGALLNANIRFLIASKYRQVRTFAELPQPYSLSDLPRGRVLVPIIPPEEPFPSDWHKAVDYCLLIPNADGTGTIYLLPRLSEPSAAWLHKQLSAAADKQYSPSGRLFGMGFDLADFNPFENPSAVAHTAEVNFGNALRLIGWDGPRTLPLGEKGKFTLYWTVDRRPETDYVIFLQLLDDGKQRYGGDDLWTLKHLYPTGMWSPGDRAPDPHTFDIPPDLQPGRYWLSVGVYPPYRANLPVLSVTGDLVADRAALGPLKVPLPAITATPSHTFEADFGPIELMGYDFTSNGVADGSVAPGDSATLTLYWRAVETIARDYTAFIHMQAGDVLVGQSDVQPGDGRYPTSIWDVGEIIITTHAFIVTPDVPAGPHTIRVGWYTLPSGDRLMGSVNGQPTPDGRVAIGEWP